MSRLTVIFLVLIVLNLALTAAQADCPTIVQSALELVDQACSATTRNQACYGNNLLTAVAREGINNLQFEKSGDIINVADVQRLQLSAMSLTNETWGVALMQLQANLPDTLPGQNVTFLLFGDVQVENAASEPAVLLNVTALNKANVRSGPSRSASVVSSLSSGQTVVGDGRNEAGDWLRIQLDEGRVGWVFAELVSVEGDASTLPVKTDDDSQPVPATPAFGPMQAFYLKSGSGDRPCKEVPDSGILVQSPQGGNRVTFNADGVDVTLGSTAYLQASAEYLTMSVVEGRGTLKSAGVIQAVPAGTFARVPLGDNGLASGPPEYPQPYDDDALKALPLSLALLNNISLTPAVTPDQIAAVVEAAQTTPQSGTWTLTSSIANDTCARRDGTGATFTEVLTYNPDGSLTVGVGGGAYAHSGAGVYTNVTSSSDNTGNFVRTDTLTFTSPLTLTGQTVVEVTTENCQLAWNFTGEWTSS